VLHRSRRLIHNNIVLHLTETPYILSLRMSRKERIHPLTPQPRIMANCRECRLDLSLHNCHTEAQLHGKTELLLLGARRTELAKESINDKPQKLDNVAPR
jgi:DTW domain-containing protein YfiP